MADLSVDYSGLRLRNPLVTGASSLGNHIDKLKRLEAAGIGAVTTKLINSPAQAPETEPPYRCVRQRGNWLLTGDQNLPHDYGVSLVRAAKRHLGVPVIAHFVGVGADAGTWVDNARALQGAGADALEMDLYCPLSLAGGSSEHAGHGNNSLGAHPKELAEVLRAVLDAVSIPVIPKLNPAVISPLESAAACLDCGVMTVVMSNVIDGHPGVDIHRDGASLLPHGNAPLAMPYTGPYLFPIHNRLLLTLKTAFRHRLSVVSGGGISTWEEVVQRVMLGASAVQICSALTMNGLGILRAWLHGLEQYLDAHGYVALDDLRGVALPRDMQAMQGTISPAVATVSEPQRCSTCTDRCIDKVSADCLAMSAGENRVPIIDASKCTGCAWCLWHCASNAIDLRPTERFVDVWDIESAP